MAVELFANTPSTTVTAGGTDAPSSGTTETWTVASSTEFPAAVSGTSQFHVGDPAAPTEMIAVTNVSGDTWSVTRGAESSVPVPHATGFTVVQVVTAGFLGGLPLAPAGTPFIGYVPVATGTGSPVPVKWGPGGGVTVGVPAPTGATAADTPAIVTAIANLTAALSFGPATLLFQDGTYQVDSNELVIRSLSNFAVCSAGATVIEQAPNRAGLPNNTSGDLMIIADSTDFRVSEGLTFDGLRDTLAPLTPLTSSAASGQPSVTVAAGQGVNYVTGQGLAVFGGLGSGEQAQFDGWAGGGGAQPLVISSVTAGGGAGGGDLITFTTNLSHTYNDISSTLLSDGYGPYACAGAYLTPYQSGHDNTVAGRVLSGEDQQNGLHLISCQRFSVSRVESRNLWESPVKLGTGFATTSLTDGCSQGTVTECICYHGYDQGVSVWLSNHVTAANNVCNATGWGGVVMSASDYCVAIGNQCLNSVYRVPAGLNQGYGVVVEGGRGNVVKANSIDGVYNTGIVLQQSPLGWGVTAGNAPTTSTFLEEATAAGTSVQLSATSMLEQGGLYSILDGAQTEAVTVASVVDGSHVTFSESLRFSHASGVHIWSRVAQDSIIEGNRVSGPQTGSGIGGSVSVRGTIKGNSVSSCPLNAVTVGYSTSSLPSGTSLAGNGTQIEGNICARITDTAILAAGSSDLLIRGNTVAGSATSFEQGIDVSGCTDTTVSGNHVSDIAGARGIYASTGGLAGSACARLVVSGNVVKRCQGEGIIIFTADSCTVTGNAVSSCGGDAGINLRGVTNSTVAHNISNSNADAGITLENNASSVGCSGNRVFGNTTRDDGSGINVTTGAAQTQKHGILESGNSNSNIITGNETDSNSLDQLTYVGASTLVFGNIISGVMTTPPLLVIDSTASDIQPAGQAAAAGSKGQPADAKHIHPPGSSYLCTPTSVGPSSQISLTAASTTMSVLAPAATTVAAGSNGGEISQIGTWSSPSAGVLDVATTAGWPAAGTVNVAASGATTAVVTYTGISGNSLTGCAYVSGSATGTVSTGGAVTLTTSAAMTGAFTAPASGSVMVTASFTGAAPASGKVIAFGLVAHGTVSPIIGELVVFESGNSDGTPYVVPFLVTGLTPGNTYDLDLLCAISSTFTFTVFAYGQTTTTPTLSSGSNVGAPVTMTVQAV